MNPLKTLVFLSVLFFPFQLLAQEMPSYPGDDQERKAMMLGEANRYKSLVRSQQSVRRVDEQFDVRYYRLDVTITTGPNYLRGHVTMKAAMIDPSVDSIRLDLMNAMTVDSVLVDNLHAGYEQNAENFDVHLNHSYAAGDTFTVDVYYQGVPGSSGFGSFEYSVHGSPNVPYIWSLSEPYGAKDWWPCKDHPSDKADSVDIFVTCASANKVGSNGLLVSVTDNGNGTRTHHWHSSYPISNYLISVAISNYSEFTNWWKYSPTDSMPVLNYVLPEHLASAQSNLPRTVEMIQIYSDLYGLYPFRREKYGISEFGWGGGMEHQTMTSVGGFSEYLIVHELAHQWFGDMITCRTWPDIWLNEGFATYSEALYSERKYGNLQYLSVMQTNMLGARSAVGSVHVADSSNVGTLFSTNLVYRKGATVLHMLRHVIGDSAFFHSMYAYANDPRFQYGNASTEDFQSVCEAQSGMDLSQFFQQWVFGEKYPHYKVICTAAPAVAGMTPVSVNIRQSTGTSNPSFFAMPLDVRFTATGRDTTVVLQNGSDDETFTVNLPFRPTNVQFDPGNWVLKTVDSLNYLAVPDTVGMGTAVITTNRIDTLRMTNSGQSGVLVSSVSCDNPEFTVSPATASLTAGAKKNFVVTFSPAHAGLRTGTITILHNGVPSPLHVAVTGFGSTPTLSLAVSTDSISFGTVVAGAGVSDSVVLTNTGDGMLSVSSVMLEGEAFVCQQSPFTLAPASSRTLQIRFDPWSIGSFTGTLTFTHDGANSPTVIRLEGISAPLIAGISVVPRWNIVSLPLAVEDSLVSTNFPGASTPAFSYEGSGYASHSSMEMGRGYWLKFGASHEFYLEGTPRQADTLLLPPGWNIVGSTHKSIPSGSIQTDPSGRIISPLYGYLNGYYAADSIQPGHGYWVKLSDSASVILGSPTSAIVRLRVIDPGSLSQDTEISYTLTAGSEVSINLYDVEGRLVETMFEGHQDAGEYRTSLEPGRFRPGVYFYRITVNGVRQTKKLLLTR